jgi:hypothetical protein
MPKEFDFGELIFQLMEMGHYIWDLKAKNTTIKFALSTYAI